MIETIFIFATGILVGLYLSRAGKATKYYGALSAEYIYRDLQAKYKVQHDSTNRWRQLAVVQQSDLRALNLADDLYPDQRDKISRLASLLFELQYEENDFTRSLTPAAKIRLVNACKHLVPQHTVDFIDWMHQRFDWKRTNEIDGDLVINEENEKHEVLAEIMVHSEKESAHAAA